MSELFIEDISKLEPHLDYKYIRFKERMVFTPVYAEIGHYAMAIYLGALPAHLNPTERGKIGKF